MRAKKCLPVLLRDETGTLALEYGFITAFIVLVIIASVTALGEQTATLFEEAERGFNNE